MYLYSGSYISLITADLAKHFSVKLNQGFQLLRGFGGAEMKSTTFITLPIEFSDITLEVDFYIVPRTFLNTPVIIGTDVLNREGVSYIRTATSQRIMRSIIQPVNIVSDCDLSVDSINTPLDFDDKVKLFNILSQYNYLLTYGTF